MTAKIKLKKNAQPVFRKKRSIPFAAIDKIDKGLERLTQCGVLSRVDYSDWAAPVVYVKKKSGEIRVCADFSTGLNSAREDHHYPLPRSEEIFTKLIGGRYFSKNDLSEAYLQIPTDDESSKLLCISTHRGLFKYQRLPFRGCPRGVMVKAMNCGIVVREFVLQSCYYVHFRANTLGKGMNPLILPPAMDK